MIPSMRHFPSKWRAAIAHRENQQQQEREMMTTINEQIMTGEGGREGADLMTSSSQNGGIGGTMSDRNTLRPNSTAGSPDRRRSINSNTKVYPSSLSVQSNELDGEGDEHSQKRAGDSFEMDELFDLNGPNFWRDWEAAGGDPDEYFKETLPNYGLVSTLFLTISIPGSIYPPNFDFQEDYPSKNKYYVSIYVICMCITTMTSLFSTLLAIGIHQQYVNAYSKPLRVDFAAKYGYLVGVLTMLLVFGAVCLWGAMTCVFIVTYNEIAAYIGLAIMFVGGWGAVYSYSSMTHWNANNYSKQMAKDMKKIRLVHHQRSLLNGSAAPPTPDERNFQRKLSRSTLFSVSRPPSTNHEIGKQNMEMSPNLKNFDRNISSYPSPLGGGVDVGSGSGRGGGAGGGGVDPSLSSMSSLPQQSTDLSSWMTSHYTTLPTEIRRIQEENDEILSKINNAPVQYSRPAAREEGIHETE